MPSFTITLDDIQVKKKLSNLTEGLKDFRIPLGHIGNELMDIYSKKVFETRGGAIGDSWRPLSASTLKMRDKRQGYYQKRPRAIGKPLIWTGNLQDGFERETTKTKLTIRNVVDYFKYHQQAGGRPMLGITKNIISMVVDEMNDYAVSLIRKK